LSLSKQSKHKKSRSGKTEETYAAIDLGSNSFHLIVQSISSQGIRTQDRLRERVRLGEGINSCNSLTQQVKDRAVECLKRFCERIRPVKPRNIRAVGTQALRKLESDDQLLTEFESHLGCPIEIISGVEEARLIWLGARSEFTEEHEEVLLIDIGGGSTELVSGKGGVSSQLASLEVGCVQIMNSFFKGGDLSKNKYQDAKLAIAIELEPVIKRFKSRPLQNYFGTSGSILAISKILGTWEEGRQITLRNLKEIREKLFSLGNVSEIDLPQISMERKKVLPGGVIILEVLMRELKIQSLEAIPGGLREGILTDLIGRDEGLDIREQTILSKMKNFGIDESHALRVSDLAQQIYRSTKKPWGIDTLQVANWIRWSALLHEAGLSLGHDSHTRHGEYLIRNSDMPGFSYTDQKMMSFLVRNQKRKINEQNFFGLGPIQVADQCRLLLIIRLAVLLNRSRISLSIPLEVSASTNTISLFFDRDWIDERPLTQALLDREKELFGNLGLNLDWNS